MGILDEIRRFTHPYEDEDDDYEVLDEPPRRKESSFEERYAPAPREPAPRRNNKVMNINGSENKVVLVKPERFEVAKEIAEYLREKRSVLLNLENTNKDIARRLLDFLSGAAYVLDGRVTRVATNTYMISPYNVDVEGDLLDELESGSYF